MASNDAQSPAPSESPRHGRRLVAVLAGSALLVAGGAVGVASAHKSIDLDIDGEERTVSTFAGSVDGLLEEQDVTIGEHDAVGPGPDTALSDGMLVVVRSASQIEVQVNGEPTEMWTTAQTTGEAIQSLGEAGRQVTVAASRSLDGTREALDLPLVDDAPVEILTDDDVVRVQPTGPAYLQDVLDLAGVQLGKLDTVEIGSAADGTAQVRITRVSHELRTEAEEIPFETTEEEDPSLYVGQRRVVQEGAAGERIRASLAVLADEEEQSVGEASDYVTVTEPVARVIAVGTKPRPAPAPAPSSSSSSGGSSSSSSGSGGSSSSGSSEESSGSSVSGDVWAALAQCESGGNPSIVSSNGLYHGLYQFSVATWQSVGGSGLPSEASPAEQTERAKALQARSGWGQWPACSARLGLR